MIKVMLVDDEDTIIKAMQRLLVFDDLDVRIVGCYNNALDALAEMMNEIPDILITDVKMPIMNGIELIQRAKEMYPLLQCVILSGYDEFSMAQAAMSEGVRHYLLKPCNKKKMENVIRECVSQIKKDLKIIVHDDNYREILIEKILFELLELAVEKENIVAADIKEFIKPYEEINLLREAATLMILRHWTTDEVRKKMLAISKVYAGEEIFEGVAQILNEFCKTVYTDESFIDKIRNFVEENYYISSLNFRYVAQHVLFMNAKYAGRQFYKVTGMKFSEYLLEVRMENAKLLLKDDHDYRMYEIAEKVGLGKNVQYYYQLFKKYTGVTPKEYQESCRIMRDKNEVE